MQILVIHKIGEIEWCVQTETTVKNSGENERNEPGFVGESGFGEHSVRHKIGPFETADRTDTVGESTIRIESYRRCDVARILRKATPERGVEATQRFDVGSVPNSQPVTTAGKIKADKQLDRKRLWDSIYELFVEANMPF